MKKGFILVLGLSVIGSSYAALHKEDTERLHREILAQSNCNITSETHPVLYHMVHKLVTEAGIVMPRYITIFNAEYTITNQNGISYRAVRDMNSYVNTMGDLYICREVLKTLSYEEIEGIVALAIAAKMNKVPSRLFLAGTGALVLTLASLYALNKKYNLNLGTFVKEVSLGKSHHYYNNGNGYAYYHDCSHDRDKNIQALMGILLTPSFITTWLYSHSLQKKIDHDAANITSGQTVINGIIGLEKVKEMYVKEGILSRIGSTLRIKKIWNTVFYPIRAFTPEERVAFLQGHI